MWKREIVATVRGNFEVFLKGKGEPICITHLYSEFNELGNYFADAFTDYFTVSLVNLREAGNSCKAEEEHLLSMEETVTNSGGGAGYTAERFQEAFSPSEYPVLNQLDAYHVFQGLNRH